MLLIVVMHRWGNLCAHPSTDSLPGAGSALTSMANAIKASGEWYAVGQRYVIAYRMIKNPRHEGHHLAPGDSGETTPKTVRDKAKEEEDQTRPDGRLRRAAYLHVGLVQRRRLSHSGRLLEDQRSRPEIGRRGRQEGRRRGGGGGGGGDTGKIGEMTKLAKASIGKYVYHQW